ncbi:MAG: hypothetical protein Ct9H90mP27_5520 [Gammaproteobacteria bacterium]|nr:MAG: hypothetical protein Ct9H90mP27_5520 [Gammaproteobacteria bacterium]
MTRVALRAAMYPLKRAAISITSRNLTTNPAVNPASLAGTAVKYDTAHNTALVEEDFNDAKYRGGRFSARGMINEDWDILLQHTEQGLRAEVFLIMTLKSVTSRQPDSSQTLLRRIRSYGVDVDRTAGSTRCVYTGGYLDREIEQSVDYTGYNNSGGYIAYYTCTYSNPAYITTTGLIQMQVSHPRRS